MSDNNSLTDRYKPHLWRSTDPTDAPISDSEEDHPLPSIQNMKPKLISKLSTASDQGRTPGPKVPKSSMVKGARNSPGLNGVLSPGSQLDLACHRGNSSLSVGEMEFSSWTQYPHQRKSKTVQSPQVSGDCNLSDSGDLLEPVVLVSAEGKCTGIVYNKHFLP